jgi:two-component system sensor histidine kinase KdpD
VGLIVSQLTARSREQALLAEARAQRTQALNQLSVAMGRARDHEAVAQALCQALRRAVGAEARLLAVAEDGRQVSPAAQPPVGFDARCAAEALARGVETGAGTTVHPEAPLRYVPLVIGAQAFGLLALSRPDPAHDTLEDQHLVSGLANQAAVALERAALERRSIAAAVEAEVERTRNTLLAGISHDVRTPLTTIVGSATTLLEQSHAIDEAHRTALLEGLLNEARRLHVLTSNLLDLTRLDEGAIQLRPEWCPADELLEAALQQVAPRLGALRLSVAAPPEAPVWCDARLVDQVLVNLVDNAIRHSAPQGTIRVAVEVWPDHWTLTVHDSGPGIAPGQEQEIFRKFHRTTDDADSTGKGLGLAICAAIAKLHGGEIHVVNDHGARFTLRLPQPELPVLDGGELS